MQVARRATAARANTNTGEGSVMMMMMMNLMMIVTIIMMLMMRCLGETISSVYDMERQNFEVDGGSSVALCQ